MTASQAQVTSNMMTVYTQEQLLPPIELPNPQTAMMASIPACADTRITT